MSNKSVNQPHGSAARSPNLPTSCVFILFAPRGWWTDGYGFKTTLEFLKMGWAVVKTMFFILSFFF
jgi:hypothetical protein